MKIIVCTRDLEYGIGSVVKEELRVYENDKKISKVLVIGPKKIEGYGSKVEFEVIPNYGRYFLTKQPNFAFRCDAKIREILNRERFDKIILHYPIFARDYGIPLEIRFHGLNSAKMPILGYKFFIANIIHKIYAYFDKRTMRYADKIGFVSRNSLEYAKNRYKKHSNIFYHVPNSVDKGTFFRLRKRDIIKIRKEIGYSKSKINLLYVGRLEPLKGIKELINVMEEIKNPDLMLTVVGEGPLSDFVKSKRFVNYVGRVPREKITNYYNLSDFLIMPSYYENAPMCVLEALECGCKIISRDVGDVRYWVNKDSLFANKQELKRKLEGLRWTKN